MQPSSSQPRPPAHAPSAPAPEATEVVTRPDPGLARGRWEAPVWFFWVVLALVVAGSVLYVLRRLGLLRVKKTKEEPAPTSIRRRRP